MALGTLDLPWHDGETDRYEACGRHAAALSRMDYDTAWERARDCPNCVAEVRPAQPDRER